MIVRPSAVSLARSASMGATSTPDSRISASLPTMTRRPSIVARTPRPGMASNAVAAGERSAGPRVLSGPFPSVLG